MRVGFIGTGLMGAPMAARVAAAGHDLCVWNRTREKAEPLAAKGARIAESAAMAFEFVDVVVLMLADGPAVAEVLDEAVDLKGKTVINMSTIGVAESRAFAHATAEAGGSYLEAPVLGSTPQATDGGLVIMVGGNEAIYATWKEFLRLFGPEPRYMGAIGKAAAAKLALNQLIGSLSAAYAYSLGLVRRHEVPLDAFLEILRASVLYAPTIDRKLPRILEHDYANPNFPLKHLLKDMKLVRGEGRELGLAVDVVEAVATILQEGVRQGLGELDYAALAEVIAPPEG